MGLKWENVVNFRDLNKILRNFKIYLSLFLVLKTKMKVRYKFRDWIGYLLSELVLSTSFGIFFLCTDVSRLNLRVHSTFFYEKFRRHIQ